MNFYQTSVNTLHHLTIRSHYNSLLTSYNKDINSLYTLFLNSYCSTNGYNTFIKQTPNYYLEWFLKIIHEKQPLPENLVTSSLNNSIVETVKKHIESLKAHEIHTLYVEFFHESNTIYDTIISNNIQGILDDYYARSYHQQKSDEWLTARTKYITASAVANALGAKGEVAKNQLLVEKITYGKSTKFFGNEATRWGEKYEPVANDLYMYRHQHKCVIYEYGLIPHKTVPFLGVSTDGVIQFKEYVSDFKNPKQLLNLEIKCPMSRVITGQVPVQYWHQIQLQLEVLDLPMSEFLECKFSEYFNEDEFKGDTTSAERGIIVEVYDSDTSSNRYEYCPAVYHDISKMIDWKNGYIEKLKEDPKLNYVNVHYWKILIYSCVSVSRNQNWTKDNLPILTEFWNIVEEQRKNEKFDESMFLKKRKLKVDDYSEHTSSFSALISPTAKVCLLD